MNIKPTIQGKNSNYMPKNTNFVRVLIDRIAAQLNWLMLFYIALFSACQNKQPAPAVSFYYWKTHFSLSQYEQQVLQQNKATTLWVRYFDVDIAPQDSVAKPISVIRFDSLPVKQHIVPVVYLKNRVFEQLDSSRIEQLSQQVLGLVSQISQHKSLTPTQIQFDCDWTDKTQHKFFYFLQCYKAQSKQLISATIRLHQVKYSDRTGIPPVDYGVLMFYNMGSIDTSHNNSIYEKQNAQKYITSLQNYPLQLDVALPIFSWGIQIREHKVVQLLNKMYAQDFENDTHFTKTTPNRFSTQQANFKSGYYFLVGDEVKIENISPANLTEMANMIQLNSRKPINNLIFYDLDSLNIANYENTTFSQVATLFAR